MRESTPPRHVVEDLLEMVTARYLSTLVGTPYELAGEYESWGGPERVKQLSRELGIASSFLLHVAMALEDLESGNLSGALDIVQWLYDRE